jgi:20S proteasome alpha/beta subunit
VTAVVGIKSKDGIVIGADSAATFEAARGFPTIEQEIDKIFIIENAVIVAGTGEIGLQQRFCDIVRSAYKEKLFAKNYIEVGRSLSERTVKNFLSTGVRDLLATREYPIPYKALLAYASSERFHLCEFTTGFQPEWKDEKMNFASMGCGQNITDAFLGFMKRVFWGKTELSVIQATFIAVWTLKHAIDLNTGGIKAPIQLARLQKWPDGKYRPFMLSKEEIAEHEASADDGERYLSLYKKVQQGEGAAKIPDV